jgi:hypothetical protein
LRHGNKPIDLSSGRHVLVKLLLRSLAGANVGGQLRAPILLRGEVMPCEKKRRSIVAGRLAAQKAGQIAIALTSLFNSIWSSSAKCGERSKRKVALTKDFGDMVAGIIMLECSA